MAYVDPQLDQAHRRATAAMHAAKHPAHAPRGFIDAAWSELIRRNVEAGAHSIDAQLAVAAEAETIMRAIAFLTPQAADALSAAERRGAAGIGGHFPEEAVAFRAAIAADPVLAKFQAEVDARAERKGAEMAAITKQQLDRVKKNEPATLLALLRQKGAALVLADDRNHIAILPGDMGKLTPADIEAVKQNKAGILALLRAEDAAAKALVIA